MALARLAFAPLDVRLGDSELSSPVPESDPVAAGEGGVMGDVVVVVVVVAVDVVMVVEEVVGPDVGMEALLLLLLLLLLLSETPGG